jgi:putative transposase
VAPLRGITSWHDHVAPPAIFGRKNTSIRVHFTFLMDQLRWKLPKTSLMKYECGKYYHVFNQGNNRQPIFLNNYHFRVFQDYCEEYFFTECSLVAQCLMPNHFHFLINCDERCEQAPVQHPVQTNPVSEGLRKALSHYARRFNKSEERTGSLFRQNTKAKCLEDDFVNGQLMRSKESYLYNCFLYIHQNPLKAKLVKDLSQWEFSSYREYAGISERTICRHDLALKDCGFDPKRFKAHHHLVPPPHATTSCHHLMPPHRATTSCHHLVPPPHATTSCHHLMPPPHATTSCHHLMPPPRATTSCHHLVPPPRATTSCHHPVVSRRPPQNTPIFKQVLSPITGLTKITKNLKFFLTSGSQFLMFKHR